MASSSFSSCICLRNRSIKLCGFQQKAFHHLCVFLTDKPSPIAKKIPTKKEGRQGHAIENLYRLKKTPSLLRERRKEAKWKIQVYKERIALKAIHLYFLVILRAVLWAHVGLSPDICNMNFRCIKKKKKKISVIQNIFLFLWSMNYGNVILIALT